MACLINLYKQQMKEMLALSPKKKLGHLEVSNLPKVPQKATEAEFKQGSLGHQKL